MGFEVRPPPVVILGFLYVWVLVCDGCPLSTGGARASNPTEMEADSRRLLVLAGSNPVYIGFRKVSGDAVAALSKARVLLEDEGPDTSVKERKLEVLALESNGDRT